MTFAHSLPGCPQTKWEPLRHHLDAVGARARANGVASGIAALAEVAGRLHDIGKCSAAFQAYFSGEKSEVRGPDHSTAGARAAVAHYGSVGRLLAFGIAGHHSGLMDGVGDAARGRSLTTRLHADHAIEAYHTWRDHVGSLPDLAGLAMSREPVPNPDEPGFGLFFLTRMLFSCLIDADFIATEEFYAAAAGEKVERGAALRDDHLPRIRAFMTRHRKTDTPVNRLRGEILDHAVGKAALAPGLFTLTVPTGGGKTLASLNFALDHAARKGLRRVIYVIPFTSIIEQTAQVFRDALGPDCHDDILEHHSSFDWERGASNDDEGRSGLAKLRRATENWDAPIVVTTAVQFYESLFAARTSRCRKLHNLAQSVIILDEAQTLPVHLLRPCMAALYELAHNYGASVVLCTATQPALRKIDGALPLPPSGLLQGFDIGEDRELAPDPPRLYAALRRVTVERRAEPVADDEIAERFASAPQMLCIVNSRAHARVLFDAIAGLAGARHLTTLMCARHRRKVLREVRDDLVHGRPVRLVATSLIEAGVDVDFPEVWRAATGLDSIAQAAGRCNREGRLGRMGRCVVFESAAAKVPPAIRAFWDAGRAAFRWAEQNGTDPLGHDAVAEYFRELYFNRGFAALDAATRDGKPYAILPAIAETHRELNFPFASIADAFCLIDDAMQPVLIPYDDDARAALATLAVADRPPRGVLRRLQQVSVPVPRQAREALLASGAVEAVRPRDFGDRFVVLTSADLYDNAFGLRIDDPTYRSNESNVFSSAP